MNITRCSTKTQGKQKVRYKMAKKPNKNNELKDKSKDIINLPAATEKPNEINYLKPDKEIRYRLYYDISPDGMSEKPSTEIFINQISMFERLILLLCKYPNLFYTLETIISHGPNLSHEYNHLNKEGKNV